MKDKSTQNSFLRGEINAKTLCELLRDITLVSKG